MSNDKIEQAQSYWTRKRGNRSMPARGDIEPGEIKSLLPNVVLLDVLTDPLDFRYRLIGTEIDEHSAQKCTGLLMSEIPGRAPPSNVWSNCQQVVETGKPSDMQVPYVGPHKDYVTTRQVVLPLSDDDKRVNMLMIVVDYLHGGRGASG